MAPRLTLRPYRAGDIEAFTPRADFARERQATGWDWAKGPPPGRTWTLMRGAEIVGVGGGVNHGNGRWQAWALLGDIRRREWPHALAHAHKALIMIERNLGAQRIEAMTRSDFAEGRRVLHRLGFAFARTLRHPALDLTYDVMARTT